MNRFHTFSDGLGRLLGFALVVLLAILVLLATAETVAWTVFDASWAASPEIQELLMVWLALLSGAWAVKERLHLAVDLVARRLPRPLRRLSARLAPVLVAVFGGLLAFYGTRLLSAVNNTLPATGLPASIGYLPAVAAGILIAFFASEEAIRGG